MDTPDPAWQLAATGTPSALHRRPLPWWQQALLALRPPVWPAVVAALMVLSLILAFEQVVAKAVEQAELRRTTTAAQIRGVWRCKLVRDRGDRDSCLAQVGGAEHHMSLQGREALGATTVVHIEPRGRLDIVPVHTLVQPMEK